MQKILAASAISALALASHSGSAYMQENTFDTMSYTSDYSSNYQAPMKSGEYSQFTNDYYGYMPEQPVEATSVAPEEVYGAWPPVNKYTTFKTTFEAFQWNGKALVSYKGVTGTAKLDGDRNKIKVDASATLPVVGKVPA